MNTLESVPQEERAIISEHRPSNKECLRGYEVNLRFLSRGCVVRVGCQEIAFESAEEAMKELNEYVSNTYETQQKWRKILD